MRKMLFGIAIIVLLSLLYLYIAPPLGREWVFTSNKRKEIQTREEILELCEVVITTGAELVDDFPGDSLEKTLNIIMKDELVGKHVRSFIKNRYDYSFELLMKGIDTWERPLIYIWNKEEGIIIIRSMGRNGRDDDGQGDDIQLKMNIGATLKRAEQYRLEEAEELRQQEKNNNCCCADPNKGQE